MKGKEMLKESLKLDSAAELHEWMTDLQPGEFTAWWVAMWEELRARKSAGQIIMEICFSLGVSGFALALAAAIIKGVLSWAGIM